LIQLRVLPGLKFPGFFCGQGKVMTSSLLSALCLPTLPTLPPTPPTEKSAKVEAGENPLVDQIICGLHIAMAVYYANEAPL